MIFGARALVVIGIATGGCGRPPPPPSPPPTTTEPATTSAVGPRGFEVGTIAMPEDQSGCARRVAFDVVDLASSERAPASLCLATLPDVPDGAWFWLEGVLTVAWPDGLAVFRHRIRAADVDPERRDRPMRVAIWRGELDGAASGGRYARRRGRLHGGGVLHFEAPRSARPELVLALELEELEEPTPSPPPGPAILIFDEATFGPGQGGCKVNVGVVVRDLHGPAPRARFCTQTIESAPGEAWFLLGGELRLTWPDGEVVIALRSYETRDPEDQRVRYLVWTGDVNPVASSGRFRGRAGTLRGAGTFLLDTEAHAQLEVHTRLDLR